MTGTTRTTTDGRSLRRLAAALAAAVAAAVSVIGIAPAAASTASAGADYRSAPRSALVGAHGPAFDLAVATQGDVTITVLARRRADATRQPVARLTQQARPGGPRQVFIERLGAPSEAHEAETLAQLYALVLQLDPEARYCLAANARVDGAACDPARDGVSHGEFLRTLADRRAARLGSGVGTAVWQVVRVEAAPTPSWDADFVSARAIGPDGPMAGVTVYFNRQPHSICAARTGADGVARCRLVDQHGDEHEHDHGAAVVATYPGDVRADRILLPTTHVLPAPVPSRAAFARPFLPLVPLMPLDAAAPGRP